MLEEARAAESTRDFISKCAIGLKEARESHVRLKILARRGLGPIVRVKTLRGEANEIIAVVTAIIRNTKRNARERKKAATRASGIPNS